MLAGRSPVIYGDGRQTRDFTYVEDIVQAALLAAHAPRVAGKVFNIACGRRTTLLELVAHLNEALGTDIQPILHAARPGDVGHSHGDISQAQADLGFCPCTELKAGLKLCLEHYGEQGKQTAVQGLKSQSAHVLQGNHLPALRWSQGFPPASAADPLSA
jgi:UDP-glucose 4-epimerase